MGANERLDQADLAQSSEFSDLQEYDDGGDERILAMRFIPRQVDGWQRVAELWLDLAPHPNILDALGRDDQGQLLVRYAAIRWSQGAIHIDDTRSVQRVATWGVQLVDALEAVIASVSPDEAAWLTRIEAHVDVEDVVRIGFLPASPADPLALDLWPEEVLQTWPACDPRGFVFVVGKALSIMFVRGDRDGARQLSSIVQRCLAPRPRDRYQTLAELRHALGEAGAQTLSARDPVCWRSVELGIGLLAFRDPHRAGDLFELALKRQPWTPLALAGRRRAMSARSTTQSMPTRQATPGPMLEWDAIEGPAARFESQRAFAAALDLYRRTRLDGTCDVPLLVARARCHLHLGEPGHAIDFSRRALAIDPSRADALTVCVSGHLLVRQFDVALGLSDRWLELGIDQAQAHYQRGKALLALKRLVEARDAFDRALVADPRLVPAMMLRREADRMLKEVRVATGIQRPLELELPASLAELRPIFANGRVDDAIRVLSGETYANDPEAQLVLARCLEFLQRFAEAAEVYALVASGDPSHRYTALLGRAGMLVELGDPDGALELLDALRTERPDDLDLVEARAWVLDRLGRGDEAQAEFRRYVALNLHGSERRLQTTWIQRQRGG